MAMTHLDRIGAPEDLKKLSLDELGALSEELRQYIIEIISLRGGHLASSLGAVEIALALHYVFDSPRDKILWDVGHQSYAHKIITGRREAFRNIRTRGGPSGFPNPVESEHDAFGVGHASTSISAALGFAVSRDLLGQDHFVVAVIGDGAISGGSRSRESTRRGTSSGTGSSSFSTTTRCRSRGTSAPSRGT